MLTLRRIVGLLIVAGFAWLCCPPQGFAQGPPMRGLRFWLDATDIDANPKTRNPTQDVAVFTWKDKVRGITFVQNDWLRQPAMGKLKNADAVRFHRNAHMIAADLQNVAFADNTRGTIVQMFDAHPGNQISLGGLEVGDSSSTAYIATHICANGCGRAGLVGGVGIQANNGPFDNSYYSGRVPVADGEFHVAIVASNSEEWLFNTDRDPVATTEQLLGNNEGKWFADIPNIDYVNFGSFTGGTMKPSVGDPGHIGNIGDIMIYSHVLTEENMAQLYKYAQSKYRGSTGLPTAPSAGVATRTYVALEWDTIPEEVLGYNIYRKSRADGEYKRINELTLLTPRFIDFDVVSGRRYYYAVCSVAHKEKTEGDKSEALEVVP